MTDILDKNPARLASDNWNYYEYANQRGHREYCRQAKRCEDMYLGGGLQWSSDDKKVLQEQGRLATEQNEIATAVNTVAGYQINNRMDITMLPRGGEADEMGAETITKVTKQVLDNCQYKWRETEVFLDGMIQQRGYFEVRVNFNDSMQGEASISVLDPMDVLPDPDAKSYNPDDWGFVIVTRWLSLDEIEQWYGKKARADAENIAGNDDDWGEDNQDEVRSRFGEEGGRADAYLTMNGIKRCRIIDRQYFVYEMTKVAVSPEGDIRPVEDHDEDSIAEMVAKGWILTRRMHKRVRWLVTTAHAVMFDGYSPLSKYSPVPYFPYFRRGRTRGMIDNAISMQEVLNKAIAQYIHIVNTTANSGWVVEQNSLVNMDTDELTEKGAQSGLVIEYKEGAQKPEKIQPNQVPTGLDKFISIAQSAVRNMTMVNDSLRAESSSDQSGVAIQSKQFIAQQQLAIPLDNLARTRYMLMERVLEIIQKFYTDEKIIRITEKNLDGRDVTTPLPINQMQPDGSILNDLTIGEYDMVIVDQPMQVTWENSQFNQGLELKKVGINIPDSVLVRHSNLADKGEIMKQLSAPQQDPLKDAEVALKNAQATKTVAEAVSKGVESMFSATTAANLVASVPAIAPLADAMLKSAGFEDKDMAPIVSAPAAPIIPEPMAENTHPLLPPNPDAGMTATPQQGITGV